MLSLPPGIQVFMALEPVDCRKSFDGLTAAVEMVFQRNVLDGHLFLTDNGCLIIDVTLEDRDVDELSCELNCIPGVVGHGIFLNEADEVLVETPGGIQRMMRKSE